MIFNIIPVTLNTKFGQERIKCLAQKIKNAPPQSLIVCGELALSGYRNFGDEFNLKFIDEIKEILDEKYLAITLKIGKKNKFVFLDKSGIIYSQDKTKLFEPNKENLYFENGEDEKIDIFEVSNVKIGVLICYEIRFLELWMKLSKAHVIIVPAMWGKEREDHFITLCKALALQIRAFVVAVSDGGENELKFAKCFTPNAQCFDTLQYDMKEIEIFMKNLGLKNE